MPKKESTAYWTLLSPVFSTSNSSSLIFISETSEDLRKWLTKKLWKNWKPASKNSRMPMIVNRFWRNIWLGKFLTSWKTEQQEWEQLCWMSFNQVTFKKIYLYYFYFKCISKIVLTNWKQNLVNVAEEITFNENNNFWFFRFFFIYLLNFCFICFVKNIIESNF